jgi:hypothetical protein
MPPDLPNQIADLLLEAGHAHHQAFIETDGHDPEWPLWYAQYFQEKLGRLLNYPLSQSEIVYHSSASTKNTPAKPAANPGKSSTPRNSYQNTVVNFPLLSQK